MLAAICINVLVSMQGEVMDCTVMEDTNEVWTVECAGKVLKLPDYACLYSEEGTTNGKDNHHD